MNFVLVQLFDPSNYSHNIKTKPFWLNLDLVPRITYYDSEIHAQKTVHPDGRTIMDIPENATETIYINSEQCTYHLDMESSKKVMEAIKTGRHDQI